MSFRKVIKGFIPKGNLPRTVKSGAFRGLRFKIDLSAATQFWLGLYERETYRWLQKLISGIASAVDVGAAAGEYSIYLLSRSSADPVLAFDPNPELSDQFSENLSLNFFDQQQRLTRIPVFLGSRSSHNCKRLDEFINRLREPIFLKIDVDGGELDVLRGAENILRTYRTRILLETHSHVLERECVDELRRFEFTTRVVKNAWWRLIIKDRRPIGFNRWLVASNDASCPV